ncbi:protein GRINL1A [Polymixia lowei]
MSSSWTQRQGQVGDLRCQSKDDLKEILTRQEKLLSNRKFLQSLPDKGKKISDFAERVRLAIAAHEEEERKQSLLSSARTELQSKYQQVFTSRQHGAHNQPETSHQNRPGEDAAPDIVREMDTSPVSARVQETKTVDEHRDRFVAAEETMETTAVGASLNSDETKESDLAEALERVKLSDTTSAGSGRESQGTLNNTATDNFFLGMQPPKKPHYIDILEKTERSLATRKQQYRPNQLLPRGDGSPSVSLSPSQSPGGSSPLSAQARKERDRKHLDDITAARLPPLLYSPARFLSLEESADLLREQQKKHQELQAKLAAQKLSEGLRVSVGSYTPDSGPMAAYREIHDDGAQVSSEED